LFPTSGENLLRLVGVFLHRLGRAGYTGADGHMLPQASALSDRLKFKSPLCTGSFGVTHVPGEGRGCIAFDDERRCLPRPVLPLIPADERGTDTWAIGINPFGPKKFIAETRWDVYVADQLPDPLR